MQLHSGGTEGWSLTCLNMLQMYFNECVNTVFNEIWNTGIYPEEWKTVLIVLLLKPVKEEDSMKSYRPMSLMSCLKKLVERVLNNRLSWWLEDIKILGNLQFGFWPQRTTIDACRTVMKDNKLEVIVAVLLDFESAFNSVPPAILIFQCTQIGLREKLLQFIHLIRSIG